MEWPVYHARHLKFKKMAKNNKINSERYDVFRNTKINELLEPDVLASEPPI